MVYISILSIYRLFEELTEKNPLKDAFVPIVKMVTNENILDGHIFVTT